MHSASEPIKCIMKKSLISPLFFKIQELNQRFQTVPLPYKYVEVPGLYDPPYQPPYPLYFYVNRVITQLSSKAFVHCGFTRTLDSSKWNASWGRQYQPQGYSSCQAWQRINHWAGAFLMGRKDNFNARMTELRRRIGPNCNFYPESYQLPAQKDELQNHWKDHHLWILKPSASSRGKGIRLVSSDADDELSNFESGIVQFYLDRPLLITGRKFDMRLYVLVPSISPLRIYIHDSGLARFCTHAYVHDCSNDSIEVQDLNMHLTNFSLNKDDQNFKKAKWGEESIENSKWSLPFLIDYLKNTEKIDVDALMENIHRVIISTVIAGECEIKKHHRNLIKHRHVSYEMYGVDVLLDENLNPYIMEVNISPAMSGLDSTLDYVIKWRLMHELLEVARIIECNVKTSDPCPGIVEIEKLCNTTLTQSRIQGVLNGTIKPWDSPTFYDYMMIRDFVEEDARKGGFSRIFPKRKNFKNFLPCFDTIEYDDKVFHDWIEMSNEDRSNVLNTNWATYQTQMAQIRKLSERALEKEQYSDS